MSRWTYITACISADTCLDESKSEIRKRVKKVLKTAPKITGSERDADIFINFQSGYNTSIGKDCNHCKFGASVTCLEDGGFSCDGPDDYICPDSKYQTCIVMSVQGDLRDRTKQQTIKEFNDFLAYLEKYFLIRNYSVNVEE